jgi:hypothetical protein
LKQDEVTLRVDTDRMTKAIQEKRKKKQMVHEEDFLFWIGESMKK